MFFQLLKHRIIVEEGETLISYKNKIHGSVKKEKNMF